MEGKPEEGAVLTQKGCGLDCALQKCLEWLETQDKYDSSTVHIMLNCIMLKMKICCALNTARKTSPSD